MEEYFVELDIKQQNTFFVCAKQFKTNYRYERKKE